MALRAASFRVRAQTQSRGSDRPRDVGPSETVPRTVLQSRDTKRPRRASWPVAWSAAAALALGTALGTGPAEAVLSDRVVDEANLFRDEAKQALEEKLAQFETERGWKLRVWTRDTVGRPYERDKAPWEVDENTIVIVEDTAGGNVLGLRAGYKARERLGDDFLLEIKERFGNMFFVREEGEKEAVSRSVDVLQQCLQDVKCVAVPGLESDLYFLTLAMSVAGGAVVGFASTLEPTGFIKASWQWPLVFSPLWFIFFVAFGMQPVLARTSELLPILGNVGGFLGGVAFFRAGFGGRRPEPPADMRRTVTSPTAKAYRRSMDIEETKDDETESKED